MKKTPLTYLLASVLITPTIAVAQPGFYLGAKMGATQASTISANHGTIVDQQSHSAGVNQLGLTLGYDFSHYFGAEARIAGYLGSSSAIAPKMHAQILGKGMLPITENFQLYGVAGIGHYQFKHLGFDEDNRNKSGHSLVYGAGAQYKFTDSFATNIEIIKISNKKEFNAHAVNLGVQYKF
jgi:opacity protein-like surface antigen